LSDMGSLHVLSLSTTLKSTDRVPTILTWTLFVTTEMWVGAYPGASEMFNVDPAHLSTLS